MGKFTEVRAVAWLKRIALAIERANELELHRQELEFPRAVVTQLRCEPDMFSGSLGRATTARYRCKYCGQEWNVLRMPPICKQQPGMGLRKKVTISRPTVKDWNEKH